MKALEKIYVDSKAIGDNISTTVRTKRQDYPTCTEYIKTDTFIEKVFEFFSEHLCEYINVKNASCDTFINIDGDKLKDDFRNYMKGE